MSAETIVFDVLRLDPAVAALVVDGEGARIFPDVAPQEFNWPLIVFARSSTTPTYTIHGAEVARDAQINITCWGRTRPEAEQIADAVKDAMSTAGHIYVNRTAGFDSDTEGYAAALDFVITEV